MLKAIGFLALLAVLMWALAIVQTGNEGTSPTQTIAGDLSRVGVPEATGDLSRVGIAEAPIGHRQPRASDTPTNNADELNAILAKENRALDRTIKNICRGC